MVTTAEGMAAERAALLRDLEPFEAIADLAGAPAGCRLGRRRDDAEEAAARASAARERAGRLRVALEAAEGSIAIADESADFSVVAVALAQRAIIGPLLASVEAEARRSEVLAEDAGRQAASGWDQVVNTRTFMRSVIDGSNISFLLWDERGRARVNAGWTYLRDWLGVRAEAA